MISVLIPVYNTDVRTLVQELVRQFKETAIPYEIILIDDSSTDTSVVSNATVSKLNSVRWIRSQVNKGRVQTRIDLCHESQYSWLLYLDADSEIIKDDFASTYSRYCTEDASAVVGGRVYSERQPENVSFQLHWKYGYQREMKALGLSEKKPYHHFMSNNFLVRKEVFQLLNFTIGLKGYGHEDTWMGMQFEKMQTPVLHINNPVLHKGLDDNASFIKKSLEALQNIKVLKDVAGHETLARHIKLYRTFQAICSLKAKNLLLLVVKPFIHAIEKNLHSDRPSLFLFDLYRLLHLMKIM